MPKAESLPSVFFFLFLFLFLFLFYFIYTTAEPNITIWKIYTQMDCDDDLDVLFHLMGKIKDFIQPSM